MHSFHNVLTNQTTLLWDWSVSVQTLTYHFTVNNSSTAHNEMKLKTGCLNDFQHLLAADHLVAVVLLGQLSEGRLDDATAQTQNQMQSGFWWAVKTPWCQSQVVTSTNSTIHSLLFYNKQVHCKSIQLWTFKNGTIHLVCLTSAS